MIEAGEVIKALRAYKCITQKQLAKQAGVSVYTVANLENGHGNPTLINFESMLEVLGYRIKIVPIEG